MVRTGTSHGLLGEDHNRRQQKDARNSGRDDRLDSHLAVMALEGLRYRGTDRLWAELTRISATRSFRCMPGDLSVRTDRL